MASRQRPRSPRSSDTKRFEASTTSPLDQSATGASSDSRTGEPIIHKDRDERIAELAYQRAEQRGFEPGHALDDWLWAEREVDASLSSHAGSRDMH